MFFQISEWKRWREFQVISIFIVKTDTRISFILIAIWSYQKIFFNIYFTGFVDNYFLTKNPIDSVIIVYVNSAINKIFCCNGICCANEKLVIAYFYGWSKIIISTTIEIGYLLQELITFGNLLAKNNYMEIKNLSVSTSSA